jgi:flagellar protein FliO/FliZ
MTLSSILLAIVSLVAVLGLVVLTGRLARTGFLAQRLPGGGNRMVLVQALALDPRRRLQLVRCDDRHVMLLTGGGTDLVVGWLDAPARDAGA